MFGQLCIGFLGGTSHRFAPGLGLLLFGQFDGVVYDDTAFAVLADLDVVFVIVVQGKGIDLVVSESVSAAFIDAIEDVVATFVDVLLGVLVSRTEEFVFLRAAFQIVLLK